MTIGGTEDNYEAAAEILDIICDDHIHIGETGDAAVFKPHS